MFYFYMLMKKKNSILSGLEYKIKEKYQKDELISLFPIVNLSSNIVYEKVELNNKKIDEISQR